MFLPWDMLQDSRITFISSAFTFKYYFPIITVFCCAFIQVSIDIFQHQYSFIFVIIRCVYTFSLYLFLKLQLDNSFQGLFLTGTRNGCVVSRIGAWKLWVGDNLHWHLQCKNIISLWPVSIWSTMGTVRSMGKVLEGVSVYYTTKIGVCLV